MKNIYFDAHEHYVKSFKSGFSTSHLFAFANGYSVCVTEQFESSTFNWSIAYLRKNKLICVLNNKTYTEVTKLLKKADSLEYTDFTYGYISDLKDKEKYAKP